MYTYDTYDTVQFNSIQFAFISFLIENYIDTKDTN